MRKLGWLLLCLCVLACGCAKRVPVALASPEQAAATFMDSLVAGDMRSLKAACNLSMAEEVADWAEEPSFVDCTRQLKWSIKSADEVRDAGMLVRVVVALDRLDYDWIIAKIDEENPDIGLELEQILEEYVAYLDETENPDSKVEAGYEARLVALYRKSNRSFKTLAADPACPRVEGQVVLTFAFSFTQGEWLLDLDETLNDALVGRDPLE